MIKSRLVSLIIVSVLIATSTSAWSVEDQPPPRQTQATQPGPSGGAVAAAVVSDIFYVPGKTATCVTSGALWTVVMLITAGTYYKEAGNLVHAACTGKWVLTGEEFMSEEDIPQQEVALQNKI